MDLSHAYEAALLGDLPRLQKLVADIEDRNLIMKDNQGYTVLHKAVEHCFSVSRFERQEPCVRLLLERAPQLATERNQDGKTPLLLSLQSGYVFELPLLLLSSGPSTAATIADITGRTPLHQVAAGFHSLEPNCQDTRKDQCFEIIRLLIQNGAQVNGEDCDGETPLHHAIRTLSIYNSDNMEMIELLLDLGAKFCSKSGVNALSLACDSEKVTKYILDRDPNAAMNVTEDKNVNPLYLAIQNNKHAVIKQLLDKRGDVDIDPICIALAREMKYPFDIIESLLLHCRSYDINTKNGQGRTLLIEYSNCCDNIEKLLELGADIYAASNSGSNALMTAVNKSIGMTSVEMLIDAGADPLAANNAGQNALSLAYIRYVDCRDDKSYALVQYLFTLPEFSNPLITIDFDMKWNPQRMVFDKFYDNCNKKSNIKFLKLLLKSNCMDKKFISQDKLKFTNKSNVQFKSVHLGPISSLLNTDNINIMLGDETRTLLKLMLETGFTVSDIPDGTVSPLTVLLCATSRRLQNTCKDSSDDDDDNSDSDTSDSANLWKRARTHQPNHTRHIPNRPCVSQKLKHLKQIVSESKDNELLMMAEDFIHQGVNVESMTLKLSYPLDYISKKKFEFQSEYLSPQCKRALELLNQEDFYEYAESLIQQLWLPDALWVSFLSGNMKAVEMLLPHWSAPPLALLLFRQNFFSYDIRKWFSLLSKFGGVSHGTEIYTKLNSMINTACGGPISASYKKSFNQLHSSPLSLLELSRWAVRASLAEKAAQPGNSLPGLLAAISPPGLRQFLLMQSPQ